MDSKAGRDQIPDFKIDKPSGVNWLLAIAIDEYKHCAKLNNCVKDAKAIVKILTERYQFEIFDELYNTDANRRNIITKLNELRGKIRENVDNLIIYFSGHGETEGEDGDEDEQIGYLVPVDAAKGDENDYLPHSFFKEKLNRIKTKHTFVIMDACFSGSFFITKSNRKDGKEGNPSRWAFSSSLSHEVALDGKAGDNSPFAQCLLETLEEFNDSFGIHGLVESVEKKMLDRSFNQSPICRPFANPNKYKGQFFFHPTKSEAQEWAATEATDIAEAYHAFWQKYPDHANAEEALWRYACKQNEVSAFQLYRNTFFGGKYFEAALDKIDDVVFEQARSKGIDQLRDYLKRFGYNANHAKEAHQLIDNLLSGIHMKTPAREHIADSTPSAVSNVLLPPRLSFEPEMIFVQGGTFKMGSNDYDSEKPIHEVRVKDFYIGKYPVTQAEWRAVMGSDPPKLKFKGCDQCPVEGVSWHDVQEFINTLNEKTKKNYRLPSEAEWEYAARGGSLPSGEGRGGAGFKYAGSDNLDEVGWYGGNSDGKTHPVGQKKPNELGIYDLSGNVWEWCADVWHDNYNGAPTDGSAWISDGDQARRVVRGGSWIDIGDGCRVSYRYGLNAVNRYDLWGFRLAGY